MFRKDSILKMSSQGHSPHNIIPTLIRPGSLVLDVGCNAGFLGKKLIEEKRCVVDGVDINKEALAIAAESYRKIFEKDLSGSSLDLGSEQYDYIIFGDILEHLPRPDLLLKNCRNYLKDTGRIIISLPNVARGEIRLKLMLGNFEYAPGIMSEDHLRFFTKKSAARMIRQCGYDVKAVYPTGLGHMIKIFPTLTAFQFIFICKKKIDQDNFLL